MNIDSIQDGIVIDHITAGQGMKLYRLLGLDELDVSIETSDLRTIYTIQELADYLTALK